MPAPYSRLRQVCLAAADLRPVRTALEGVFGLSACHEDPHVAKYGLRNVLFPIGTDFLEVVAPERDDTAAGRFLARSEGRGAYMAIFDCSDPEARAEAAQRMGVRLAHRIEQPGYRGFQLHPKDCRATMLEFDRSEGADDLRGPYFPAGGTEWVHAIRTGTTLRMTHVVVESPDAPALATHWSRVLGRPLSSHRITTDALGIHFKQNPASGRESLTRIGLDVVDAARMVEDARSTGLDVEGDAILLAGVWFDLRSSPATA